jgi:hypothetical protein
MPKFIFTELVDARHKVITARLGAGTGAGNNLSDLEVGKFVKQSADSRYDLCAVGNEIEGFITSMETSTQDAYSIGSVQTDGRMTVTFDGLQATPGTGTLAIGDFVVTGTPVAKGTGLLNVPPKVCKATAAAASVVFTWRVVSGTGALGTVGLIERV